MSNLHQILTNSQLSLSAICINQVGPTQMVLHASKCKYASQPDLSASSHNRRPYSLVITTPLNITQIETSYIQLELSRFSIE